MQPVNDDINNLFRQAADNYPLNTQGADFDKLLQRMDATGDDIPPQKEGRRRYGWLLLLLLLPLPFLCRYYYTPGGEDELPTAVAKQYTANSDQQTATPNAGSNISTPGDTSFADTQNTITTNTFANPNSNIAPSNSPHATASGTCTAPLQKRSEEKYSLLQKKINQSAAVTSATTAYSVKKSPVANRRLNNHQKNKSGSDYLDLQDNHLGSKSQPGKAGVDTQSSKEKELASGIAQPATVSSRQPDSLLQIDSATHIANMLTDTVNATIAQKERAKDSTVSDTASLVKKQQQPNKKVKPILYVGAIAGVDYSVVKSTQTAGTGYNAGGVVGYQLGRHWAVETGLLRAYKKYRSEGEYIDTAGLGLAGHTQVMNASGSCGILEIPLMVQYHFNSKGRSHWYAAAGLSSYLIKKEEYYYVGKRYNMVYYAEKEYTNSTKNWFSIMQLGGGYQWQLGKQSSLRAEPYVKLPLSKIGIANLPLSSAGINIGYIRSL